MGVYIKGMKKPSDCQYCVMYRDGYCGAKGGFCRSEKGVDADCPIVEVVEVNESEIPTSSEIPNNCTDCECTDDCTECKEAEHGCKDEPTISKMEQVDEPQTCSFSDCDNFKNPDYARCIECKRKQIEPKTEPQTEREDK